MKKGIDERFLKNIEAEPAGAPFLEPRERGKEFREKPAREAFVLKGLKGIVSKPHAAQEKSVFV